MSPSAKNERRLSISGAFQNDKAWLFLLIVSSASLTVFTVFDQVFHRTGIEYVWEEQLRFHRWVIDGTSYNPWQYRILVPYIVETIREIIDFLGLEFSYGRTFFGIRLIQNFLIFITLAIYLTRLRVNRKLILVGLALLAWGITYSGYASSLAFDNYFDVLFYLLAVLLILDQKYIWLIPLSLLAAFNRETGIFIPILIMVSQFQAPLNKFVRQREFRIGAIGLLLFLMIIAALRIWYGPRDYLEDYPPGINLFKYNFANIYSYFSIFATFSIIPVLALMNYKNWPEMLRRFFWLIVPLWIVIHMFTSVIAEARLFLVPYVLILLPTALMSSQNSQIPTTSGR